jgi:glycosyltransferase involved in cell wall biosynthesis
MRNGRHILMTTDAVGGVWVYSTMLAQALAAQGDRVTLVTLGPAPNDQQRAALADHAAIDLVVTDLALEWMDPAGEDRARAGATLLALAHEWRPDIVHLNSYREGALPWPAPVLVVAHSCVMSWSQACHDRLAEEPRWRAYAKAVNEGLRAADAWAAPTAAFRGTIQALYAPPTLGIVIHNGIEAQPEISRKKRDVILASGRLWDRAKNLATVVAAAPQLPWPVEIAGPLSGPCGETARQDGNVRVLGELARPQLLSRMQEAAIYVAPARYEPFGLGVLEAAQAGCALVLSDIPTLRELWDDAALFVPCDDVAALAAALQLLCEKPDLRGELQIAASARARCYAIGATARNYSALCDAMLGRAASAFTQQEARA